jgi:hypothetical protein
MAKLSDTQAVMLSAAAQRCDRNILPLPGSLRGGAARTVVAALLKRGLVAETATDGQTRADTALNRIWRNDEDGCAILLHITDAGLAAIGLEPEAAPDRGETVPEGATEAPTTDPATEATADAASAPKAHKPRTGTKQAKLIEMLRTEGGATIDEIVSWLPHPVRGSFAGTLKKRLGLEVTSETVEGRGRAYRLPLD